MLSDKLREVLGRERADKLDQLPRKPIKPVYKNPFEPVELPIDPDKWLAAFCKMYKDLYEVQYELTEQRRKCILHFNSAEPGEVIIIGGTGTGKTSTMVAMTRLLRYTRTVPFDIHFSGRISQDYSQHGANILDMYCRGYACIDDLGAESLGIHYGSKVNISQSLIETRYNAGRKTHFTTNLNPEELREYIGDRAYSRIKHNRTVFVFDGKDMRG